MIDEKRFKINKESIDRLFPKTDPTLDYLTSTGYKSPVTTFVDHINTNLRSEELKAVMNVTARLGVEVDEGELLKALRYDRDRFEEGYRRGYRVGYDRRALEVAEEIFAEISKRLDALLEMAPGGGEYTSAKTFLDAHWEFIANSITSKYTESEKEE